MSAENVETVLRTHEALGKGDFEAAARGFHPDATWHNTSDFPGEAVCVGVQAIMDFWRGLLSAFEWTGYVEQVLDGEDTVVLGIHSTAQGRASGVPVDAGYAVAHRMRDGKIGRADVYGSWDKAVKAVGLDG